MEREAMAGTAPAGNPDEGTGEPLFYDLAKYPQLDVKTLKQLATDPEKATKIMMAQYKLYEHLDKMADLVMKDLARYEKNKAVMPTGPVSVRQLAFISKKGETGGKTRKELAKDLLVAGMINYGNLNWNPADPSTSWKPEQNPSTALSLLMLGPIQPPG